MSNSTVKIKCAGYSGTHASPLSPAMQVPNMNSRDVRVCAMERSVPVMMQLYSALTGVESVADLEFELETIIVNIMSDAFIGNYIGEYFNDVTEGMDMSYHRRILAQAIQQVKENIIQEMVSYGISSYTIIDVSAIIQYKLYLTVEVHT